MIKIPKILTFICFAIGLVATMNGYAAASQGYVHELSGDVQVAVGPGKPIPVTKNQLLENNSTITTGPNSNVVLKFIDGTVIALNQNTSFIIQKYEFDEKAPSAMTAAFAMLRGGLRAITGAMSSRNRDGFKLATPNATIGIRGTEFLAQLVNPLFVQVLQSELRQPLITYVNDNPKGTAALAFFTVQAIASNLCLERLLCFFFLSVMLPCTC